MPNERDSRNSAPHSGKVISLRGHQAAERAVDDLLAVGRQDSNYISMVARAFSLGPPILSALARRLDAERPRDLLLLAELAGRYPGRGQVVRTLARAANDRRARDSRRLGAALALCLYDYGVILPPLHDFLGGLSSAPSVLASTLVYALEDYSHDAAPQEWEPLFALLLSQPPEILFSVVGSLADELTATKSATAPALRLLALHSHPDVMAAAVEALAGRTDAESVQALATLQHNLPTEMGHAVGRQLQKLRLSGILNRPSNEAPPSPFHAQWSAIDGRGRYLISLERVEGQSGLRIIELILSDTQGIIDAALNPAAQQGGEGQSSAPRARQPLYGEQALHRESLVSIPIGYCQSLLRSGVRSNWTSNTGLPVAYLLECGAIWDGISDRGDPQEIMPDQTRTGVKERDVDESSLLSHPGFADWYLNTPATHLAAHDLAASAGVLSSELTDENWRILLPSIIKLAHDEFVPEMRLQYAKRLRLMADWLYYGGQHSEATMAAAAAFTMTNSPPEANLFVLRLVQKGILVALGQI